MNGGLDPVHVEPDSVADQRSVASLLPMRPQRQLGVLGGEGAPTTVSDDRMRSGLAGTSPDARKPA